MIGDGSAVLEHEVNLNDDDVGQKNDSGRNLLEEDDDVRSPQRASLEAAIADDDEQDAMRNAFTNGAPVSRLVLSESRPVEVAASSPSDEDAPLSGTISVSIRNYEKRGEGINAYVVYLLVTEVQGVTGYTRDHYEVWRRFSDFLGLHEKLAEKLAGRGIVLPHPPEKSITALTKTKTADAGSTKDVAATRKRLLERYMSRLVSHGSLRSDCDVRDYLMMEVELPKATNTSTLSSAGMKRMFKSVGEAFSKIAVHMEEGDRWFEQMQSQTDEQEEAMKRMHGISESLVNTRRELAAIGETFSKSLSLLASCEESTALARCLSHLTECEETIGAVWERQSDKDTQELAEAIGEYVSLFNSLKAAFAERHRVWQNWQTAQQNITKKREQKTRLELAGKTDKAAVLRAETEEAVQKADALEVQFGRISDEIKREYGKFESTRKRDLKAIIVRFLETLKQSQEELLKAWQRFAPETAVIPV
ncbi:hypothetical protein PMAYCL1PPCAC_24787 [Pristionchus mayeri]|uniref:PX domain-containing protein n=1 Tax=Pristionchus mayeri TaxID=1317129 RepID=A0AAN5D2L6_9BILA|nr:hypothetical protein PMAYCL1PPCAC_24787 [Pristionchus mayeri]